MPFLETLRWRLRVEGYWGEREHRFEAMDTVGGDDGMLGVKTFLLSNEMGSRGSKKGILAICFVSIRG